MTPTTLRAAAQERGLHIGAAVAVGPLLDETLYAETLAREFSMVTAENVMKFGLVHPRREGYHFAPADAIVDFAARHSMQVRGHTLVWHNQLPDWLTGGSWTADQWRALLEEHIAAVAGRYQGRIAAWDVINEAVDDDGSRRNTPWLRGIGPEYLDLAFRLAYQADPQARLFYNDYGGEGLGPKSDAVFGLVRGLLDRGAPVHGVGLQMHIGVGCAPQPGQVAANLKRLAGLGLEVQVTEMDVRIQEPFHDADLQTQAGIYGDLLQVCLEADNCTALVLWGFTDRHSWAPAFFKGWGKALIFDAEYRPKPAHAAMLEKLAGGRPPEA